jgi:hypothetical protein
MPTNPWNISGTVAVGDVVYQVAGADRTVARADASDSAKRPPLGVVCGISGSTALVACNGEIATGLSGLTAGTVYWLGSVGAMVTTQPASNAYIVGVGVSETELLVGYTQDVTGAGGTGGGTVTSVTIASGGNLDVSGNPITTSGNYIVNSTFDYNVAIASGGTGATTATTAYNNLLSAFTTPGSMVYGYATPFNPPEPTPLAWLAPSTADQLLYSTVSGPAWQSKGLSSFTLAAGDNVSVSDGTITTSGTATVSIELPAVLSAPEGTGLTSTTEEGSLLYGNSAGAYTSQNVFQFLRNRIVNGTMMVRQRGITSVGSNGSYPIDRFYYSITIASSVATLAGSALAPTSTALIPYNPYSLLYTVNFAATAAANETASINYKAEGNFVADMDFGLASAKTITLSFWVRAAVAGTYCVSFRNAALNRSYVATYTAAATGWEQKVITINADTTGTWLKENNTGLILTWDLGSGSNFRTTGNSWQSGNYLCTSDQVNVVGTSGSYLNITLVQLELGSIATPFAIRPYYDELKYCQRYYLALIGTGAVDSAIGIAVGQNTSQVQAMFKFPVPMVTGPTSLGLTSGTWETYYSTYSAITGSATPVSNYNFSRVPQVAVSVTGRNYLICLYLANSSGFFSAEL